jgi:hypothetical protein
MVFKPLFVRIIIIMIFYIPSAPSWAEGFTIYKHSNNNDTIPQTELKYDYLSTGINFGNNTSFFGRNGGLRFPFYALDASYFSSSGIWASATAFSLINSDKFFEGADLSIGWMFDITQKMDGGISYSHFISSRENSLYVQSTTSRVLNSYVGLDWDYLYSSVGLIYLFGGFNDYFISFSNSRYFEIQYLFNNYDMMVFEPRMSLVAGTQNFASVYNEKLNAYFYPQQQPLDPGTKTIYSKYDDLKIINFELRIPFTYNYSNFSFESAYTLSIPINLIEGDASRTQSLFTFGFYYIFPVTKSKK